MIKFKTDRIYVVGYDTCGAGVRIPSEYVHCVGEDEVKHAVAKIVEDYEVDDENIIIFESMLVRVGTEVTRRTQKYTKVTLK